MLKDFITNAEFANQAIIITTTESGYPIIYVNQAFTELNGYSLKEAKGRQANFLRSEEFDHNDQKLKIKLALEQKMPVIVEMINKHKDGSHLRIELHIFPFYENGKCTHFIGVQNDLSFLDNPNYINFFENAPVAFFQTEINTGKFMMANKACANLLGYNSVQELMALEKSTELYVDKNKRKRLLNKLRKSGRVEGYEIEMKLKDGRLIWVSGSLHMNCKGKCIEGTLIDITSNKEIEKQLEKKTQINLFKMQSISAQLDAKMAELNE